MKSFLLHTPALKKPKQNNEYYYDKEEYINPKEIQKQTNEKKRLKEWSKAYKKFYKMANSAEKIRFGYKLTIEGLNLCGLEILKSDTANEILDKSKDLIQSESYTLVTEDYNSIRYGNLNYREETIQGLNNVIQTIKNSIGKKQYRPSKLLTSEKV